MTASATVAAFCWTMEQVALEAAIVCGSYIWEFDSEIDIIDQNIEICVSFEEDMDFYQRRFGRIERR